MASSSGPLAPAGAAIREVVAVKVKFELNSKNRLRRVIFGLEKDTDGDKVTWKINFQLFERDKASDPYDDPMVDVEFEIDTELHNKAQAAADKGLTSGQSAHALGPAGDDMKAAKAGEISQDDANDTAQATLRKK